MCVMTGFFLLFILSTRLSYYMDGCLCITVHTACYIWYLIWNNSNSNSMEDSSKRKLIFVTFMKHPPQQLGSCSISTGTRCMTSLFNYNATTIGVQNCNSGNFVQLVKGLGLSATGWHGSDYLELNCIGDFRSIILLARSLAWSWSELFLGIVSTWILCRWMLGCPVQPWKGLSLVLGVWRFTFWMCVADSKTLFRLRVEFSGWNALKI